ncbi:SDR family NAD(P)-dependent oxidoreductase [Pseudonocardia pini]|uniref:SDR family NAD(P)-dependent oxidoreductase n=1 Tax=Pseudonocardia pini TaxID=2758030 RepID=UPI0015F0F6F4|nr:SDR family NAD(P)-dependent oxidoreductase [Pseudonocardia pini]
MARIDVQGALALVTGAGGGIGRETALALARRGARVLCTGRTAETVERTAELCRSVGAEAESHVLDVTDRAAMEALAARAPVDILVNNAGVGMSGHLAETTAADWTWIRGVNLDGVVHGCAVFAPGMLARGRGHIVILSSGLAYLYPGTEPAYVATKAAVLALSRSLRADLAPRGVGVTAICPGITDTAIVDTTRYLGSRAEETVRARSRARFDRGHPPAEVATAIVRAVERNRAVVPVGIEARVGWWLHRYLPLRAQQVISSLPLT